MNVKQKLDHFTEQQIRKHVDCMVLPRPDGSVVAYGKYVIKPTNQKFAVHTWDRQQHEFTSKRAALAWCSAERHHCFNLANDIARLDQACDLLTNDVWITTQFRAQSSDQDFCDVLTAKLGHKQSRLAYVKNQLENCLTRAKYIGLKDFNNETARTLRV